MRAINEAVRGARQERGELTDEIVYETDKGKRAFASGDRVLFTENDRYFYVIEITYPLSLNSSIDRWDELQETLNSFALIE